jgi:hypothetical protein
MSGALSNGLRLPLRQPVPHANAGRFEALHPANALGQFRREQAVVRSLRGQFPDWGHSINDGG